MVADKIENSLNAMNDVSKDGSWDWSYTVPHTDAEHLENTRHTLARTREYFNSPEKTEMWFVSVAGSDLVLAFTGNSPSAKARAGYIAWCNPKNMLLLINRLRELEAEVSK